MVEMSVPTSIHIPNGLMVFVLPSEVLLGGVVAVSFLLATELSIYGRRLPTNYRVFPNYRHAILVSLG